MGKVAPVETQDAPKVAFYQEFVMLYAEALID
jgi:hypothetical protein